MSGDFNFTPLLPDVAAKLWGSPKPGATKTEVRFGDQRTINPIKGTWFDFGEQKGGGVLALIERELGLKGRDAIEWLRREFGADIPDASPARSGGPGQARASSPASSPRKSSAPSPAPAEAQRKSAPEIDLSKPSRTYDYRDLDGNLVMQVCRYDFEHEGKRDKTFRQRRPDPSARSGWSWKMDGVRFVPYRLAEIREAIDEGSVVFFVEGEKAADAVAGLGVPATTNPMGAGKWFPDLVEHFAGADVVIIPDRDRQARKGDGSLRFHPDGRPVFVGQDHALGVAQELDAVAKRVRILELPGLPEKGDAFDWVEAGGTTDGLFDLLPCAISWKDYRSPSPEGPNPDRPENTLSDPWDNPDVDHLPERDAGPREFVSKFHAVPWDRLDDPGPEHEWLIDDWITRGEVVMVAGPSQSGKSFLGLDLALAINRGVEWHGNQTLRGGVIYQAGEGGKGIRKRLKAYRQGKGLHVSDRLPFVLLPSPVDLYASEDQTNDLIAEIRHWAGTFDVPLELVVIDTLSAATPGADENSSKDVGPVLARCQRIARECGCAVMLVHHMNASGSKVRGHTSILANLDSVIIVEIEEGKHDSRGRPLRVARLAKQKDGENGKRIRFVLEGVNLGQNARGKDVTSCVVAGPDDGVMAGVETTGEVKGLKLTPQAEVFLRAVHQALDEFGIDPPATVRVPRHIKVVEWGHVRNAFEALDFSDEPDATKRAAAIRQAAKRHGELLMSREVIMKEGKFVWLTGRKVRGFNPNVGKTKAARAAENATPVEPAGGGAIDDLI